MLSPRVSFLILTLLVIAVDAQHSSDARAAFEGDKENLTRVIARYRENLERLKTWKGKARMTNRAFLKKSAPEALVETAVEFAYDAASRKYRYNITTLRDVSIIGGKEEPRLKPMNRAGLFTREDFYHFTYYTGTDAYRKASVDGKKKMQPGWHVGTFEAMYFFTHQGGWHDQDLKVLVDGFESPAAIGSVTRDGDIITVRQVIGDDSVEKDFSLAKGGNATRITTVEKPSDGSERVWQTTWDWENVNGVWVPKSARRQEPDSAEEKGDNSSVEWEQNLVNVALDEREFSVASLGLRQGDFIVDSRTKKKMRAEGPEFPARESQGTEPARWWLPLVVVTAIVAVIGALILLFWRHRKGTA